MPDERATLNSASRVGGQSVSGMEAWDPEEVGDDDAPPSALT